MPENCFASALLGSALPLVAEIKLSDGDGRTLMDSERLDEVVEEYHRLGVPCLSVVTGRWFGGDPTLLTRVAAQSGLPILRKDFLTRRSQLRESLDLGASAVLLTAQLLPPQALQSLIEGCLALGLTPFVEIVSADELHAVPEPEQCVIAVNNKDIRVAERDSRNLARSHQLLDAVLAAGCPLPVSASGIGSPATAASLLQRGYRGLLVGTALLTGDDLTAWQQLRAPDPQPS